MCKFTRALIILLVAAATSTVIIFINVTYTITRYVTLDGENIPGISELIYAI